MSAVLKYLGPYQEAQLYNGRKVKRNEDITVTSGEAASLIAGQPGSWEIIEGYEPPEGGKKPSVIPMNGYAGTWDAHTIYQPGMVVEEGGQLYLALTVSEGEAPVSHSSAWKSQLSSSAVSGSSLSSIPGDSEGFPTLVWSPVSSKVQGFAATPTLTSGFSEAHYRYVPPQLGWGSVSAVRQIHLDTTFIGTDQAVVAYPSAQGNLIQGITSTVTYGSTEHAAVGTVHNFSARFIVNNSGSATNELANYFGYHQNNSTVTPGRIWFTDWNVHTAIGVQHSAVGGLTMFMNNHYNGSPANSPAGNISAATGAGHGGGGSTAQNEAQTYPLDYGLGVFGTSGLPNGALVTAGYTHGLVIGTPTGFTGGSNWNVSSLFTYGATIRDYITTGLQFTHRAASPGTASAMIVYNGVGYVGIGTQTSNTPLVNLDVDASTEGSSIASLTGVVTAARFIAPTSGIGLYLQGGAGGAGENVFLAFNRCRIGFTGGIIQIDDFNPFTTATANKPFSVNIAGAARIYVYAAAEAAGVETVGAVRFGAGRLIVGSANSHVYGDSTSVAARLNGTSPAGEFLVQNETGSATYLSVGSGALNAHTREITNVTDPTSAQSASTKKYTRERIASYAATGTVAENIDRRYVAGVALSAFSSGVMSLVAVYLEAGQVVKNINLIAGTTATGTVTHRWAALFSFTGTTFTQVGLSAETLTTWSGGEHLPLALETSYTVATSGLYYVGFCEVVSSAACTAPRGYAGSTNVLGLTPILAGTNGTGLLTPATCPLSGTIASTSNQPYVYLT